VNTRAWQRVAVGAAAGVAGYASGRMAGRAILTRGLTAHRDGDGVRSYRHVVTIYRPLEEVYAFWRDLPSLARIAEGVIRVDDIGDRRSRWIVEGPGSSELEFIAEIVADEPERLLAWRTEAWRTEAWRTEESPMPHEGRVEFARAPGGRGTEVRVEITHLPPAREHSTGGSRAIDITAIVASLIGAEPDQLVRDAVRRVKQVMEAGEVIVADGTSTGRRRLRHKQTSPAGGTALFGGSA
jgi:uncharacterized membrane protein